MLYTTDISMNKINTKKKPDTVKKIINARPVEYNEEKKPLIQFSLYKSTIKLINL